MFRRSLVGVAFLATALGAQAAVVFSDNFDASVLGLNTVPTGWTVSDGTVDVVNGFFCQSGQCVDLDGSSRDAGVLSRSFSLTGGVPYTLSFDLSGNKRGGADDVTITFGSASLVLTALPAAQPYATQSLDFTPVVNGSYSITFSNAGGDNVGAVLDNVAISATPVPEPQTYVLMALALVGLSVVTRWRTH